MVPLSLLYFPLLIGPHAQYAPIWTVYTPALKELQDCPISCFLDIYQFTIITPARVARSAARRVYDDRVPILRARARQPCFGCYMQYCILSLISITNVQKYCKRAKVRASVLLWHFKTIWIENICLPFIEVYCSNQQKLFHFAHRGVSYFLISTQNFNKWRPIVGINILVLTNALSNVVYENEVVYVHRKTFNTIFRYFDSHILDFGE